MNKILKNSFIILALFTFAAGMPAFAQLNPYTGVGGYDPGVIDQTNLMQIRDYELKSKSDREREAKEKEQIEMQKKLLDEEMNKLPNKEVSFILNSVSFKGNTVFTDDELMHLICDKVGTEVTINELITFCNLITDYYQQRGYISSIAYLPPQRIQDGNIEVIITEGKYGNITLEGNKWAKNKFIVKQQLQDNKIVSGNVLNVKDIQEALQEINSTGYMKGAIALQDNEESFAYTDVDLGVKDRFPFDLDLRFDNQGRSEVGLNRAVIFAGMYNLTGLGDKILSTTTLARHTVAQGIFYSVPIAKNETKLNLGYTFSNVKPDFGADYNFLGVEGKSHNFFATVSRRFIQTDNYRLYGDLSLDFRNSETTSNFDDIFGYKYNTRAVRLNLTNLKDDMYGKWVANVGTSLGLPIMDASDDDYGDDDNPSAKFLKFNADVVRLQILPWRMVGILQASGQWANRGLWPSEQMYFGGISSIRGYQEGFLLSDSGLTASAELRFPVPFLNRVLPEKLKFIDDSIRLAAFYDMGWLKSSWSNPDTSYLMSVGGGLVLKMTKYLSSNVYVGIPIGDKPENSSNCRVHFTITSNVL